MDRSNNHYPFRDTLVLTFYREPSSPRRHQMRQDSGYASARPSIGRQSSWNNGPTFRRPSKPTRQRSGYDGCIDSPISEVSMRSHNSERDVSKQGSKSMSPVESPLSPTSAALVGEAPASQEDRYRSREPLRQNDDQYVKKRPQPKVAEAYRWVIYILRVKQHAYSLHSRRW